MPAHRALLVGAVTGLTLLSVTGFSASGAQAAPGPNASSAAHSLYPPSVLTLSIGLGENTDAVQRAVSLRCLPLGGDHPDPVAACDALVDADGDLTAVAGTSGACTREYRPVTATAQGVWRGRLTSYRATYSNACVLSHRLGPLFAF